MEAPLSPASPYKYFLYQQLLRANDYGYLVNEKFPHPQPRSLKVSRATDGIAVFRDAVEQDVDGKKRYIYSLDDKAYGADFHQYCQCHSHGSLAQKFKDYYHQANIAIGGATQKSNVRGRGARAAMFFTKALTRLTHGQRQNDYHKFQESIHDFWREKFISARSALENGEDLTDDQCSALGLDEKTNPYYSIPQFTPTEDKANLTHIGHASALLRFGKNGKYNFIADPLHYQSGTDTMVRLGASLLYPRETAPAFPTNRYPGGQIVWISHNHHDHLCPRSLKEAFSLDTIFIVPKGDGAKLKEWGFNNVTEMASWNDEVTIAEDVRSEEKLSVRALPARHASNRNLNDYMQSLYMGCIVTYQDPDKNATRHLITGDTGVLDKKHFEQLHDYIQKHGPIHSASIASGPDRPRKLMECTHQSSADALVMHTKISLANWDYHCTQAQSNAFHSEQFTEQSCQAVAYHQGCYRLGLLSYADVTATVTRMLAFLDNCDSTQTLETLSLALQQGKNKDSFYWVIMDEFERQGIIELLASFNQENKKEDENPAKKMTVGELKRFIQKQFVVPKIGTKIDLGQSSVLEFQLDYKQLIVNIPAKRQLELEYARLAGYYQPLTNFYEQLSMYEKVFSKVSFTEEKKVLFRQKLKDPEFIQKAKEIPCSQTIDKKQLSKVNQLLGELTKAVQGDKTHDDDLREEGIFQTLVLTLAEDYRNQCHPLLQKSDQDTNKLLQQLNILKERYGTTIGDQMYRPTKYASIMVAIDKIQKYGLEDGETKEALMDMSHTVNQPDKTGPKPKAFGLEGGKIGFENISNSNDKNFLEKLIDGIKELYAQFHRF